MSERSDLVEFIQACWNTSKEEAQRVQLLFFLVFGAEEHEKHICLNGPICSMVGISPDNYLELCTEIERIVVTGDRSNSYFISGIRSLLMAKHYAT